MSSLAGPPAPGVFAPFSTLTDLVFGPHNHIVFNGLRMNDRSLLETYWVDDFTGFGLPPRTSSSTQNVQQHGSLPDTSFYGERVMGLTGWIQAGSYPQVMRMMRALENALISVDERPMFLLTQDSDVFTQPDVVIYAKVADVEIDRKIQPGDITGLFKRPFNISFKASNPSFFAADEKYALITPNTLTTTGRVYNKTYDYQYTTPMDSSQNPAGATGNNVIVHNDGNWISQPTIKFKGPMSGISLRCISENLQQFIYVSDLDVGEEVIMNTLSGDIVDENGDPAARKVSSASDWMVFHGKADYRSGDSHLTLFVTNYESGSGVEITWRDTSI